jgi:hypothetical protein
MSIHAANPDKSRRLLRVLGVLSDRQEHSTLDLITQAQVCAVSACVSELRSAGHKIECKRRGDVWHYRLAA